jgi:hypothetical protein
MDASVGIVGAANDHGTVGATNDSGRNSVMPTSSPTFGTPVLGKAEKALNAILARELAGTGLTERGWVTLTLALAEDGPVDRDALARRVAGALKAPEAEAHAHLDALEAAGLLAGSPAAVTDAGRELHGRIRVVVTGITGRLWGDLPAGDLEAAGRVLATVLERANAELASPFSDAA